MAYVSARDITDAKRQARDSHISETGESTAAHIFVHVPGILGVDDWSRWPKGETDLDYEHAWKHDDSGATVVMERTRMGWRVSYSGDVEKSKSFGFSARKQAEARLVQHMLNH